jgi:hypothetical protein
VKDDTVVMFRPTGPKEWTLVAESGCKRWPPRLPDQPIFYPVTNERYAVEIARDWNVQASGEGYVTRFRVKKAFMDRYPVHQVGGGHHTEWWVPAEELEALNDHIVGNIEVVWCFNPEGGEFLTAPLPVERYADQRLRWPESGEHVLAQYDDESVVVYQAYRPGIARYAVEHGRFGGPDFSFGRMSWIKPNFLWMMYRSGWGTKQGQEVTLAVRLRREAFDAILAEAVHSSYVPEVYETEVAWKAQVARSQVRLQWDPDHAPGGAPVERRAIQVGLRGEFLRRYGREWVVAVEDVSSFVEEQRAHASAGGLDELVTPAEEVYPVADAAIADRLGVAAWP